MLRAVRPRLRRLREILAPNAAFSQRSFAQEGEDLALWRMFDGQLAGFYVDVGSHHPRRFSNTYLLYRRGWRGLCIDPLPGTAAAFARARPRDIAIEMGVSGSPGALKYHMFNEPALNGFDAELSSARDGVRSYYEIGTRMIQTDTLAAIIALHLPPDVPQIDLFSVDVEGLDFEVLNSNDWTLFRPRVVVAECLNTDLHTLPQHPVARLLAALGYTPIVKTGHSVIFKRSDC